MQVRLGRHRSSVRLRTGGSRRRRPDRCISAACGPRSSRGCSRAPPAPASCVRIEDLDPQRSRPAFEAGQLADLRALGIDWDGPVVRQSERLARYDGRAGDARARRAAVPVLLHAAPRSARRRRRRTATWRRAAIRGPAWRCQRAERARGSPPAPVCAAPARRRRARRVRGPAARRSARRRRRLRRAPRRRRGRLPARGRRRRRGAGSRRGRPRRRPGRLDAPPDPAGAAARPRRSRATPTSRSCSAPDGARLAKRHGAATLADRREPSARHWPAGPHARPGARARAGGRARSCSPSSTRRGCRGRR